MSDKHPTRQASPPSEGPGVVSTGWLAAQSVFEHKDERKLFGAFGTSFMVHLGLFLALIVIASLRPEREVTPPPPAEYKLVFLQTPGPGGGGGGNPAPAPARELEIPKPPEAQPIPIIEQPVVVQPPPELPQLTAPVYTPNASIMAASGDNIISLAAPGGGGQGTGLGEGSGSGLGEGTGGGFGGGAREPGNGVQWPDLLYQERPEYTSEAMRAKVQGTVELEAVIMADGSVGDVRVIRSLDARFGLDQKAIVAARKWRFRPCTLNGQPVECKVPLEMIFRLH